MARLLAKIWRKEALSPNGSDQLMDIMFRCETGLARIKGLLPPGTSVAHKTGTLNIGVTDDVGIIELPNGAGHVVLTVFVKEAKADLDAQERTLSRRSGGRSTTTSCSGDERMSGDTAQT